jgi:transposase
MAYSTDLRERVIRSVRGSLSRRAAARRFMVSDGTAIKWLGYFEETGSVEVALGSKTSSRQ